MIKQSNVHLRLCIGVGNFIVPFSKHGCKVHYKKQSVPPFLFKFSQISVSSLALVICRFIFKCKIVHYYGERQRVLYLSLKALLAVRKIKKYLKVFIAASDTAPPRVRNGRLWTY